jgi:hypothetical protein
LLPRAVRLEDNLSAASEWVDGLTAAIYEFSQTRGSPVVVVHLAAEAFRIQRTTPGPGDQFVTFEAYPDVVAGDAVLATMIRDDEGNYHTARVVLASLQEIRSVDLLHGTTEQVRTYGFRAPAEPA